MRGCFIFFILLSCLLLGLGCGQSEITLTGPKDQGADRPQTTSGEDQGPQDAIVALDSSTPDSRPAVDRVDPVNDLALPADADSQILVPDDPLICKPCVGPESCPADGARTYMCMHARYKNSDGITIDEHYCTLICDTLACPPDFDCNVLNDTNGNPVAQVCMAQPYGVCALLP